MPTSELWLLWAFDTCGEIFLFFLAQNACLTLSKRGGLLQLGPQLSSRLSEKVTWYGN